MTNPVLSPAAIQQLTALLTVLEDNVPFLYDDGIKS